MGQYDLAISGFQELLSRYPDDPQAHEAQRLLRRHRRGGDVRDQLHVLARRETGDEVVELEHEPDVLAAVAGQLAFVRGGEIVVEEVDLPAGGRVEAAQDVEQRGLAAARRAQDHDELAPAEIQVHGAQRVHFDLAHAIDLGEAPGPEHRRVTGAHSLRRHRLRRCHAG